MANARKSERLHHELVPATVRLPEIRLEHQIAAAYGGREEIVDAVQRLLREQALKTR